MGVKRFGVAFLATASIVLGSALPARAQEAPPPAPPADPPAQTTTTPTTSTPAATPAPDPAPSSSSSEPAKADVPAPASTPSTDAADRRHALLREHSGGRREESRSNHHDGRAHRGQARGDRGDARSERRRQAGAGDAGSRRSAAHRTACAPTSLDIGADAVFRSASGHHRARHEPGHRRPGGCHDCPGCHTVPSAESAETAATTVVSLRPRPAPSAISLLPVVERTVASVRPAPRPAIPAKTSVRQTCARPTARVPLSADCVQARAISALRVRLTYLPSSEVRAAIVRGASRVSIRRVDARPPPKSTAAKEHPVAEARPTVPFGSSGHGASDHSFTSSSGATWSSRVFVLAAPPVRVPRPSRFARVRIPSTIPHGVIAAPPPARPG